MAYTCTVIMKLPSEIAAAVQAYLTAQTPTTIHCISTYKVGAFVAALICWE